MKNHLDPHKIISAGDMSLTSLTSDITNIKFLDNICIYCKFTGSPVGTFHVYGSELNDTSTGVEITLPVPPAPTGAAGTILIDLNQQSYDYIYVTYVKASGTGSVDVYISGKSI
jgi:hypothetical protein